jgi:hypothetical protein
MNTQTIKSNLITAINQTDNPYLLWEISKLMEIGTDDEQVIKLSQDQTREIERVIKEVESGKFKTHREHQKSTSILGLKKD